MQRPMNRTGRDAECLADVEQSRRTFAHLLNSCLPADVRRTKWNRLHGQPDWGNADRRSLLTLTALPLQHKEITPDGTDFAAILPWREQKTNMSWLLRSSLNPAHVETAASAVQAWAKPGAGLNIRREGLRNHLAEVGTSQNLRSEKLRDVSSRGLQSASGGRSFRSQKISIARAGFVCTMYSRRRK